MVRDAVVRRQSSAFVDLVSVAAKVGNLLCVEHIRESRSHCRYEESQEGSLAKQRVYERISAKLASDAIGRRKSGQITLPHKRVEFIGPTFG